MDDVTRVRLRTLLWGLLVLPLGLVILPGWMHRRFEAPSAWEATLWQWLGVWLLLNGLGLGGWCVRLFNVQGRGTPLPLDPPTRFVAVGPYRIVRNPMALGAFLFLAGEALCLQSRAVGWYLLGFMTLMHLFVVLVEEPQLIKRFGEPYAAYRTQVPRWIPRPGCRQCHC